MWMKGRCRTGTRNRDELRAEGKGMSSGQSAPKVQTYEERTSVALFKKDMEMMVQKAVVVMD